MKPECKCIVGCYISKVEFERGAIRLHGVWVSMRDWLPMIKRLNQQRREA